LLVLTGRHGERVALLEPMYSTFEPEESIDFREAKALLDELGKPPSF
jgi:hypothetical protein